MKNYLPIGLFLLMACGQAKKTTPADPSVLIEADMAFSNMSVEQGMGAAFIEFADNKAMILQGGQPTTDGIEDIRRAYGQIPPDGLTLRWEPLKAEIAASGDLGYTYGKYELTIHDSVQTKSYGKYLSVWKLQEDGSWKYVADAGASDPTVNTF
ncbi:MAG: hypothetical protein RLO12_00790 [Fulvivirga sp.]